MPEPTIEIKTEPAQPRVKTLSDVERAEIREQGGRAARCCGWLPGKRSRRPRQILRRSAIRLAELQNEIRRLKMDAPSDDLQWLHDNLRLVRTDVQDLRDSVKILAKLPQVRTPTDGAVPRTIVLARALVAAAKNRLSLEVFSQFIAAVQEIEPLRLAELDGMPGSLKLALLELLAENGHRALEAFHREGAAAPSFGVGTIITSLRFVGDIEWKETLEDLSVVHHVLLLDPSAVYGRMDFLSRQSYRRALARIAAHSDVGEIEVARLAVTLAEEVTVDRTSPEALRDRVRHVGYYLLDEAGSQVLRDRVNYRAPVGRRIQRLFRTYPDEIYIIGIETVTLITVVTLIMTIVRTHGGWGVIAGALLLILPATQAAVELMNYFITSVLAVRDLPKLNFSKGIDPSSATMVAIPTLLLNEKQIRQLVEDLEIRYLVNRDPNIFFALLTDLPDTAEPARDRDERVDLAVRLIDGLNEKYADSSSGGFYLFHRHRVYNPREGTWMGWERKRGKLLDLNQLLRNTFDPFPIKAGNMARLPKIRYVLTLDSDTALPRGSAHRMIGAMAHPLNRPLIDPELNIVTQGYGILQPRVGISVHSATRSRLANIYSGQTGFDIYSRAVSDVYQDLYGEGIFTGKGIYDVDALRQVLEHRFPRNALLSHDLIEGAYARAGLASDIEVIDDYPSHYSAYNRRKHRWLRGDWQIVRWIFNKVPDESRRLVVNPISLVSRWKIVDNLRRSLMEPATFFLLVAGWFFLPGGPKFWTAVTLALLFLPIYFRLIFAFVRAWADDNWSIVREAFTDFATSHFSILLNIAFLAHQAIYALDAIVRTIVRSYITHSRLLEWETATEAELGIQKRAPVDLYLDWIPVLAIALGLALFLRPEATPYALPFLVAWCCSKLVSKWLNRSPLPVDYELSKKELRLLREVALRTWRYFAEFSNENNHWLIPDNVQQQPDRIAERLSPTNLGLLLNARQAALEFGYLTVSEFISLTEKTIDTTLKLPRQLGHLVNWYDNLSLKPLEPQFVSTVDSGNFVASVIALKQCCLELFHRPLIRRNEFEGLRDHYRLINEKTKASDALGRIFTLPDAAGWIPQILQVVGNGDLSKIKASEQGHRWRQAFEFRTEALREEVTNFMPWYLPEFEQVRKTAAFESEESPTFAPDNANRIYDAWDSELQRASSDPKLDKEVQLQAQRLRAALPACRKRLGTLVGRIEALLRIYDRLIREMDFTSFEDKSRTLLTIGYDVPAQQMTKSCYDLLASEARAAAFIAVAKGEAPQDVWFRLGRQHTICEGENVLISWTGTMFEYLMPVIWMKSYPNTLLDRAVRSAVRAQQAYGRRQRVPWGISESAYSKQDPEGVYQYAAFGVPGLALSVIPEKSLVVSPYSTCLALLVDPPSAVENLMVMAGKHWLSDYGFYESADYTDSARGRLLPRKFKLARCWMAHHQGMSLTAICNVLHEAAFQRWFHAEPLVQASDLILQERPLRVRPIRDLQPRLALKFARRLAKRPVLKARASA